MNDFEKIRKTFNGSRMTICAGLAAAAMLTGAGLWLGQHALVLLKAVRVCLECVGIG